MHSIQWRAFIDVTVHILIPDLYHWFEIGKMSPFLLRFIQIWNGSLQQIAEEYFTQGIFQLVVCSLFDAATDMAEKRTEKKFQMILKF